MNKALLLGMAILAASPAAWANASQTTAAEEHPASVLATPNAWKITVGGGLASVPRYEGAATNRFRLIPLLDAESGRFFAGTIRGIGYNFSDSNDLQYGLRMTLDHGRRQNVDMRLNGMGDLGYTGEAGAFVNARFESWYVSGSLAASSRGTRGEFDAGYATPLSNVDRLRVGAVLDWGNNKYNQTYFGINAAQAAASGNVLSAYNASSGIKDYGITANWMHNYSREWFSNAGVSFKQLAGSARNSPLTAKPKMNSISFVLGYRF
ncbi:MAG: hypothetical protein GC139_09325 [Sideroxydans sp.]|nr:hypothetical protein [Sideroxydans sp.]